MLNHARNSYITSRKQLRYTISHRTQIHYPHVCLFCILISSGSRSTDAVDEQSKQRSEILKLNNESTSSVFQIMDFAFN